MRSQAARPSGPAARQTPQSLPLQCHSPQLPGHGCVLSSTLRPAASHHPSRPEAGGETNTSTPARSSPHLRGTRSAALHFTPADLHRQSTPPAALLPPGLLFAAAAPARPRRLRRAPASCPHRHQKALPATPTGAKVPRLRSHAPLTPPLALHRMVVRVRLDTELSGPALRAPGNTLQKRSVSSPAPVTMFWPSGDTARYSTRSVWPGGQHRNACGLA